MSKRGEAFTVELPLTRDQGSGYQTDGYVGRVGRTEEELRRARRDWLAGVAPTPGTQELIRRNENSNEEPQFGRAPRGRYSPLPGLLRKPK